MDDVKLVKREFLMNLNTKPTGRGDQSAFVVNNTCFEMWVIMNYESAITGRYC
jgi:hypothetical protein